MGWALCAVEAVRRAVGEPQGRRRSCATPYRGLPRLDAVGHHRIRREEHEDAVRYNLTHVYWSPDEEC